MTAKESEILRRLIDRNWDFTHEKNSIKKLEIAKEVAVLKAKLIESMGKEAYEKFMDTGRRMFAPKESV